jgi:sulfite exporter TauE/SafE
MENPDINGHAYPNRIMQWILIALLIGLALSGTGLYLLAFTDFTTIRGLSGIISVVVLITLGLLLIVPAKIYIILRFTRIGRSLTSVKGTQDKVQPAQDDSD